MTDTRVETRTGTAEPALREFVEQLLRDAATAFRVLDDTGTLTPTATLSFVTRVPGTRTIAEVKHPDRFRPAEPTVVLTDLDGDPAGLPTGDGPRYAEVFRRHPQVTTISHVHAPHLGAWAQTHRPFPLHYVPSQRHTVADHLPVYLDRREGEDAFIVRVLAAEPYTPGILEANGGATIWSDGGVLDLARTILTLEEGARLQVLAAPLGGSRDFGPGTLAQQWRYFGLLDDPRARARLALAAAAHPLPPA